MYESSIFGHENTSKKTGKALKKGKFMSVRSIFSYFKGATLRKYGQTSETHELLGETIALVQHTACPRSLAPFYIVTYNRNGSQLLGDTVKG